MYTSGRLLTVMALCHFLQRGPSSESSVWSDFQIIRMLSGLDFRAYYFLGFVAAAAAIYAGALTSHIVLMVLLVCMGSLLFAW